MKLNDMPLDWNALMNDEKVLAMFGFSDSEGRFPGHAVFGCYVLLLRAAWVSDFPASLPNNDAILAGLARIDVSLWQKVKPVVMAPFALRSDGRYHQKKMRQVYEACVAKYKNKANAGKIGANRRWSKTNKDGQTDGTAIGTAITPPMANQCIIEENRILSISPTQDGGQKPPPRQFEIPTIDMVLADASMKGYKEDTARRFWNHFESTGWIDKNGHPIAKWRNRLANFNLDEINRENDPRNKRSGKSSPQKHDRNSGTYNNPNDYEALG